MDSPVRLFGRLYPQRRQGKQVASVRLRLQCATPATATVHISDVQLQPGKYITGWTLHSADLGLVPVDGWELRNGVLRGEQTVIVTADATSASPLRLDAEPLNGAAVVQVGAYQFGQLATPGRIDGLAHSATQGAGLPPYLTARSDVDLHLVQPAIARSRLLVWMRGIYAVTDDSTGLPTSPPEVIVAPGTDPGLTPVPGQVNPNDPESSTVTADHPTWAAVLKAHATWADVLAFHTTWS